jgi:hypothetical protein
MQKGGVSLWGDLQKREGEKEKLMWVNLIEAKTA